jgi:Ca2+-binding EF-hand superfamily protein
MRAMRFTLMGIVAFLLVATQGFTQFESKSGSGRSMDPNKFFDSLSQGKDVWNRSEAAPHMQAMFDAIARKLAVTDGRITREQFVNNMMEKMKKTPGDAPPRAMPPGALPDKAPGYDVTEPDPTDARAEESFRRLDLNGDGVLDYNEMPNELRSQRDQWDADGNGYIDLNEYKAYFRARMQQIVTDRSQAAWQSAGTPPVTPRAAAPVVDTRAKVYHYDNLPKELPPWFKELDTNHDAQVALYEWKASGRPISEFLRMDRNNDGFLTVEEVLWYESQSAKGKANPVPGSPSDRVVSPMAVSGRGPAQVIDATRIRQARVNSR